MKLPFFAPRGWCFAAAVIATTSLAAEWPQYRGPQASGVNAAQALPTTWNVETGENVRWQTPVAGLAHASPIAWGARVYVVTAIAKERAELKVGLYGDIDSANDNGIQQWRLLALEKNTGEIIWNTLATEGRPKVKRHTKASHANSTPATDGQRVVAIMGSEGLFSFDTDGKLQWRKDLGPMDSGYYAVPSAQWGFGSSPIIRDGKVVVLCDVQTNSFIAAFGIADGRELWRTPRKDVPTWGSPTVLTADERTQIVVNGWHETAGFEFDSGKKLWTLDGGGDIPVPTPIFAHGLIYLTSAHGPWRPLRAVRPSARGNITPADPAQTNASIVWAHGRKGSYMQTPIVVGDRLFACNDMGILTCCDARTGVVQYSERLSRVGQGFTASPVSDGRHLYFPSELGNVFVVPAMGPFSVVAINPLPETCMSAPAIINGILLFRTRERVLAISAGVKSAGVPLSASTAAAKEPPAIELKPANPLLVGQWQGAVKMGEKTLRVLFTIEKVGEKLNGDLTSVDQGNQKIAFSRMGEVGKGTLRIELDEMGATFEGRWNEAFDEIQGEFQQFGKVTPVTLKRSKP